MEVRSILFQLNYFHSFNLSLFFRCARDSSNLECVY